MNLEERLSTLEQNGNLRHIPGIDHDPEITDLSTNDYLGLATRPDLLQDFLNETVASPIPFSSSASRLLASEQLHHTQLESLLSSLYDNRPALLFNSGYHANTGLVSALASTGKTLIVADKLVHASIIDGIVLSKAPFTRFPHNDFEAMERIVAKNADQYENILLITESVYSMDGDYTNIDALIETKRRHPNVMLYIDEAHAFGVEGPGGLGLCSNHKYLHDIDIIIGTLGKAAASSGAFAICTDPIKQWAINRARSFIFSTALPPICSAWSSFIIRHMTDMDVQRAHLKQLGAILNESLRNLGLTDNITQSHIQPIIIGSARKTVELSNQLLETGFKVLPIRTPTVPPGTERLRISLSASLTIDDITNFSKALEYVLS